MITNSFHEYLESLLLSHANLQEGTVANYIPELAKADPAWFGIALVTADGHVYQVGDSRQTFTIQSISKALTYGLALEDRGTAAVLRKVGVEPSGEAFNSISLEPDTGRPLNPMINAGAIATVSALDGTNVEEKFQRLLRCYEKYVGHTLTLDTAVYQSEKASGHRNRAIAYLLKNSNIIEQDPDAELDVYFQQCSILINCRDLAVLGATLANNGVNPITGVRALQSRHVPKVLSVMSSCGMYDYSGAWIYEVGMPAKSGVGGGIVAVLPGQFGLAVFSPKLDERGNSVRGLAVCKQFSADFGLHLFDSGRATSASVIHGVYDGAQVPSKRHRRPEQIRSLLQLGQQVGVIELQGDLVFASEEIVLRESMRILEKVDYLILDFNRVGVIHEGAFKLLTSLIKTVFFLGKTPLLTGVADKYPLTKAIKKLPKVDSHPLLDFDDVDHALEWCENQLLALQESFEDGEAPLSLQPFCADFTPEELAALETLLERKSFQKGEYLCREGEEAESLYFILSGQVSVNVPLPNRRLGRISTCSAGSAIGEMSMLDRGRRSADLIADTAVTSAVLNYQRLESHNHPLMASIKLKLLTNIACVLSQRLRRATLEIKSLRS